MSDSSLIVRSAGVESPSGESILLASPIQGKPDVIVVAYQTYMSNALGLFFAGPKEAPITQKHPHLHVIIKNDKPLGFYKPDAVILNCGETSVNIEAIGGKNSGASTSVAPRREEHEPWVRAVWDMLGFDAVTRSPHYEPVYMHTSERIDGFLENQPTRTDRCVDDMFTDGEIGPRCHAQIKQYIAEVREFYREMVMAERKVRGSAVPSIEMNV